MSPWLATIRESKEAIVRMRTDVELSGTCPAPLRFGIHVATECLHLPVPAVPTPCPGDKTGQTGWRPVSALAPPPSGSLLCLSTPLSRLTKTWKTRGRPPAGRTVGAARRAVARTPSTRQAQVSRPAVPRLSPVVPVYLVSGVRLGRRDKGETGQPAPPKGPAGGEDHCI